ncbi:MAG: hypothetical protein Ct9H300mP28_36100 [Pseudomonadota bacterium]|nr:MAG: hypothetical protein Ct9H300mP28_36100 [Pseudomonadota bacterium]
MRNLEREIGKVCRKVVTRLVRTKGKKATVVTPKLVHELLGVPKYERDQRKIRVIWSCNGFGCHSNGRRDAAD